MKRKHMITAGLGAVVLLLMTAGASAYIATEMNNDQAKPVAKKSVQREEIRWNEPERAPVQKVASNCDDGNVVGYIAGGALGGIAGSQFGDGNGKTATTIGGALGGGYLGKEYIPTHNVTCR